MDGEGEQAGVVDVAGGVVRGHPIERSTRIMRGLC
jgi:hypothetical protein